MPRILDAILQDLRFALRAYCRSPGFTITALLAISLGIGATSAVVSVTDRILFRALPYCAGNRLVSFGMLAKVVDDGEFLFASDYKDLPEANTPFKAVTSWSGVDDCDINDRNPIRQRCAEVDWNFFQVLGIRPILGETFSQADVQPGAPRKALLTFGLWQSHFGGNRDVVGKTVTLDGDRARIVGVLPTNFELPSLQHADLVMPQINDPAGWQHGATRVLRVIGRLKDDITLERARAQLSLFFDHTLQYVPRQFRKEVQFRVRSLRDRQVGSAQLAAWTLLGAVLAVMLISCANVANLLLARAAVRQGELAIRSALGISRGRLLSQMLTESLLLAFGGGAIGCLFGAALLRVAVSADPDGIPYLVTASIDGRVLAISMGLSILSGIVFGLIPAFQCQRPEELGSARGVTQRYSTGLKNTLVVTQIALSTMLLAAGGLLVRSLWNLETQPLGMQTGHVLTAQLVLPASRYIKPEERVNFFNQVERQLGAIPGIRAVGASDSLPPGGWERSRPLSVIEIAGQPRRITGTGGLVNWRYVSPGYFPALRIPLREGRNFQEEDRRSGLNLCILSNSLARRLFPTQDAVGQHIKIGTNAPVEIVGIAADVKNTGLSVSDNPEYYIMRTHSADDVYLHGTGPVAQRSLCILLRSPIGEATLARLVRQRIAALDSSLPVKIQTMRERLGELDAGPRFDALLMVAFASVGLFLAAVGLYGTIAYLVAQRTQEIGIRMSLGATPVKIARLILTHTARWTLAGAAVGVLSSLVLTRILASLLYRVSPRDPLILIVTVAGICFIALLATANPAVKAATVDPAIALRNNN
ncbi:MAG TPA: ABC transporter permease [Bryobacteraceae bacterium]|nr:ABC transporter permease [Bryobacteraceae bacterium]